MAKRILGFILMSDELEVNLREDVWRCHAGLTRSLQHRRYAPQDGTETADLVRFEGI